MNSKRSFLDTLNAGRPRRHSVSLEELNRSLQDLESRLDRGGEPMSERRHADPAEPFGRRGAGYDQPPAKTRDEARSSARMQPGSPYQALARDFDRLRGQEEGAASIGRIAAELKGLREELRHQMTAGIRREFDALRTEIARAYAAQPSAADGAELGAEFERLSETIQQLAERSDDRGVSMLRQELGQVRSALDALAREETVRAVDRRWDDFDKRWTRFEDSYAQRSKPVADPALDALNKRLEQITEAVSGLPESLSLRSLEEKVRVLAAALDHFAGQQDQRSHDTFALIEERLDEISRAIVASSAAASAPHFDPEPFERIEARIASLARQVEELIEDRPVAEVITRLNTLAQQVDELASRDRRPDKAMERLGKQIAAVAERIERMPATPDVEPILRGIEQRFDVLSKALDRRQDAAIEYGQSLFRDLEQRLNEVARRIDASRPAIDPDQVMREIEQRFMSLSETIDRRQGDAMEHGESLFRDLERRLEEVTSRLDERQARPAFDDSGIMSAIDERFAELARRLEMPRGEPGGEAMKEIEARLEDISSRLESSAAQIAMIDPTIIRDLEAQVAELSAHLSRPSAPLPERDDIAPRLEEIERSISASRDSILEAAREAAQQAVAGPSAGDAEAAAVAGLAEDLKALEALTRRSDERNTKTFEAIHDTLLKIVDRLGSIEQEAESRSSAATAAAAPIAGSAPAMVQVAEAPSIETDDAFPPIDADDFGSRPALRRSPAEAAAAAAAAAMDPEEGEGTEQPRRARSLLGGLTRAFSRRKTAEAPAPAGSAEPKAPVPAPSVELDQPLDPKAVNRPLEPGSGAPDVEAIMKRVRGERPRTGHQGEAETARSDFIAAARRAAQAAAAEAGTIRRGEQGSDAKKPSGIAELLRSRRKPILMGAVAIMLALAGLQLGKAFFAGDPQVADRGDEPTVLGSAADVASAMTASSGEKGADAPKADAPNDASPVETAAVAEPRPARPAIDTARASAPAADPAPSHDEPAAPIDSNAEPASVAAAADETIASFEPVPVEAGPAALREAADSGDPKALFEVGSRYAEGRGVKSDMAAAAKWYERSAELGFAPAQYRIGNFLEKGTGVERSIAKAKTWYQLAAEQGNASAMHNLAVLYAMGADGVADNESAARWFTKAAELGVKDSQFNLGILSAKGVGVPQDLEESYKWFALVAKAGDRDAATKRDEVANALRPEQLARARAAVELWKPKPVDPEANVVEIPEGWGEPGTKTASVDMKKAIANVQKILNKNGYEAGSADGVMGEKTKSAIRAFQADNGLEPTGEIDEKLVKLLLEKK
ncbi:MAG TPA: peptidoglycan-binding protein [Rhizobiales bacterium]|nr:peptidoglycan-binding protein [Hyphomicrobiales bacterium]